MDELIFNWNKQHPKYVMSYEKRIWYDNGNDNVKYILQIKKEDIIITKSEASTFLEAFNVIKDYGKD